MSAAETAAGLSTRWLPAIDARVTVAEGGHVNRSFFVSDGNAAPAWLLQRVNSHVFPAPLQVMHNILLVLASADAPGTGIDLPTLLRTTDGAAWSIDDDGELWRCWVMVPGLANVTVAADIHGARETARAFGAFARRAASVDGRTLAETIPGFHATPNRLAALHAAILRDPAGRVDGARQEIAAALDGHPLAIQLIGPLGAGRIPLRVAHNDAKVSNVLFDRGGIARMVIDLDTVMPGTLLFDFGDLVRSGVSQAAEDATDLSQVHADEGRFRALVEGYLEGCGTMLTTTERSLLEVAGRVITWEQAIRFLTDYLNGDRYFAVAHAGQNLERTRTQLALLASLKAQRVRFAAIAQSA